MERVAYFAHSGEKERITVRGNKAISGEVCGTFNWTAAVKALALLLVKQKLCWTEPNLCAGSLVGEAGSHASSLDFAISKQPLWLLDMFGVDAQGLSLARYLIQRQNPERKRAGPVVLSINPNRLSNTQLILRRNGKEVNEAGQLLSLYSSLEAELPISGVIENGGPNGILQAFSNEALQMMQYTDIFVLSRFEQLKRRVLQHRAFARTAGRFGSLLADIDRDLPSSVRLGMGGAKENAESVLARGPEIICCISPAHVGTILILHYLKKFQKANLKIKFDVPHSVEMASRIVNGNFAHPPHICSLTVSTAAYVLARGKKAKYLPFMFMPCMTHGVLGSPAKPGSAALNGTYLVMKDPPASEAFCLEDLTQQGSIGVGSDSLHAEPDEVAFSLKQGDPRLRAIIGFPYYYLNPVHLGCELISTPQSSALTKETLLFARSDVATSPALDALRILVRDAWLLLRNSEPQVRALVQEVFENQDYVQVLSRCSGITNLLEQSAPLPKAAGF